MKTIVRHVAAAALFGVGTIAFGVVVLGPPPSDAAIGCMAVVASAPLVAFVASLVSEALGQ